MLLNLQNVTILCNILKWEDSSEGSWHRKDNNKQKCRSRGNVLTPRSSFLTPPFSGKDSAGGCILNKLGYGYVLGQQPCSIQSLTCTTDAQMLAWSGFQGSTAMRLSSIWQPVHNLLQPEVKCPKCWELLCPPRTGHSSAGTDFVRPRVVSCSTCLYQRLLRHMQTQRPKQLHPITNLMLFLYFVCNFPPPHLPCQVAALRANRHPPTWKSSLVASWGRNNNWRIII